MQITMKKLNIKYLQICLINIIVLTTTLITYKIPIVGFFFANIIIFIYYLYLLSKNNEIEIALHQIFMFIISNFIIDLLFHYLKIKTPIELKYISEGISIILLLHILIKKSKYKNLLKDKIILCVSAIAIFGIYITIVKGNNIGDFLNAIRLYFRFIPIYIIFSNNKMNFKYIYIMLYIANIIVFLGQVLLGGHQDLRTGIWGIIGGSAFQVFVVVFYINILVKYLYKRVSFKYMIIALESTIAMFVFNESKAYLLILILASILIILINKTHLIKKVALVIVVILVLVAGWNFMIKVNPKFAYLGDITNLNKYIESYLFGNSNTRDFQMGRFEAGNYIRQEEQKTVIDRYFGLGLGLSIPKENTFYIASSNNRQIVFDFKSSQLYEKYGRSIGYHLSTFNSIIIDGGYLGVLTILGILLIILIRGITLIIKGIDIEKKIWGSISLYIVLSGIYTCGYSNGLINRAYMLMICVILGVMNYNYKNIKHVAGGENDKKNK